MNRSPQIIEWFWQHGKKRRGEWRLPLGTWLDKLYTVADQEGRLRQGVKQPRGAVALWGSSQTGKSTFLSGYIDKGIKADGSGTALGWSNPAIFSDAGKNVPKDVCVYNPFNAGNDGSACVTRFVLANMGDGTVDPDHPVQVRLFGQKQILSALAFGFLTECKLETNEQKTIYWDGIQVQDLLSKYPETSEPCDREAYELLRDVMDVLELLTHSRDPRYGNLLGALTSLRQAALDCSGLLASKISVLGFAARLFWNGWPSLTQVFSDLCEMRRKLASFSIPPSDSDLRISCSLEMAALLVDFSTYENLLKNAGAAPKKLQEQRYDKGGAGLILSDKIRTGHLLITPGREQDFAMLQALTWELIVPLRADVLRVESPKLFQLLSVADLLDFPGTANEADPPDYKKLTDESISLGGDATTRVYTNVIKRGKTSSLVLANARNYDIDGFSIFAKWGTKIVQRGQLDGGISAWWDSYLHESFKDATVKKLPLNFVVTFFGALVSEVINRGALSQPGTNFEGFFGQLGTIRSPKVASSFTITYNHVPGSKMESNHTGGEPTLAEKTQAENFLLAIPEIKRQFIEGNWHRNNETENSTIHQAIFSEDGGTDYFIDKLIDDATQKHRQAKIQERYAELKKAWQDLTKYALPESDNEMEAKRQALEAWRVHLIGRLNDRRLTDQETDAAQKVSFALRAFLHVEPTHLMDIPVGICNMGFFDHADYLINQMVRWEERIPERLDMKLLGIEDEAHATKLRRYIAEAVLNNELERNIYDQQGVVGLLRVTFGNTTSDQAADRRSFLAVALSRALAGEVNRSEPHAVIDSNTLRTVVQQAMPGSGRSVFDYHTSAHYRRIIEPIFNLLESAVQVETAGRQEQEGDQELLDILR